MWQVVIKDEFNFDEGNVYYFSLILHTFELLKPPTPGPAPVPSPLIPVGIQSLQPHPHPAAFLRKPHPTPYPTPTPVPAPTNPPTLSPSPTPSPSPSPSPSPIPSPSPTPTIVSTRKCCTYTATDKSGLQQCLSVSLTCPFLSRYSLEHILSATSAVDCMKKCYPDAIAPLPSPSPTPTPSPTPVSTQSSTLSLCCWYTTSAQEKICLKSNKDHCPILGDYTLVSEVMTQNPKICDSYCESK